MQELAAAIAAQVPAADGAAPAAAGKPLASKAARETAASNEAKTADQGPADTALEQLRQLTEGLYFVSESDAPLAAVSYQAPSGALDAKEVLKLLNQPADTLVQEQELTYFLRNHTADDGVLGSVELANRFKALQMFLKQELEDVKVYRIGKGPQVEAYALGKTSSGKLAGFKTTLVET
ncbi:nuclease A inhibitor family protein [Hymenobacter sp. 15J16-1T3B]|nr:nuclease A inhibitor family protein [Hymenobacter sp. 15J16-1T3B]MCC3156825.1 nuclease A inhibitor family protein [Hymenobacter sp. 15J16-1T3B]